MFAVLFGWGMAAMAARAVTAGDSSTGVGSADYLVSIGERLDVFAFWTSSNVLLLGRVAKVRGDG